MNFELVGTASAPEYGRLSRYRWVICALLFGATAINYIDRQILGLLAVPLQLDFGWSESQYGLIIMGFQLAYAAGLLIFGRVIDWIGTRVGYAVAVGVWSLSAAAHGLVTSVTGFGAVRVMLGLGEGGNFPAAIKAISEWFPNRERALAVGLFNSGSTVGAIATPLVVPWIAIRFGWRAAFLFTGLLGLLWIPCWLFSYRNAPVDPVATNEAEASIGYRRLLRHRETWVFLLARALTEPVWWFYLFWAPKFLSASRGISLRHVGLPLVAMYLMANAGGLIGGWISSALLKRGWTINAARKLAVLVCALCVVPVAFDSSVKHAWFAIGILGLAMAGHQGWASNLFAMLSDIYPSKAVGSITGLTGIGAAIAGAFAAVGTGYVLEKTGSYLPVLIWAGISYLVVLGEIHFFIPKIQRIEVAA
jgi:ACS family hexuronate transporter-like MFS transporter